LLLCAVALLLQAAMPGWAAEPAGPAALRAALAPLVEHGGVAVGEDGRPVFLYRPGAYVPASILKLATALAAFHELGPDFRWRTEVYRDGDLLYLRGTGDPFLVSEEWALLAGELAAAGHFAAPLRALVLDESAFAPGVEVDGAADSLNPYDARLGALVANFNTVFVTVDAAGQVASAEPQTPLTPLARRLGRALPPGEHRINFTAQDVAGVRYAGELAQAVFEQAGARFAEPPRTGRVPAGLRPALVHRSSRTLREVVAGMLEFSNNFIANQVVLQLALATAGEPARLEPGVARVRRYLEQELGLDARDFALAEGSGLSRRNRIELAAMLRVVDAFHPWRDLLQPYGKTPLDVPAKTGTLTGVYTLAGFLPAPPGVRRPFVIMLNQERHTRGAVFRRLVRTYAAQPPQPTPAAAAAR
jgi:D-alanyl-D-alanine carboxypeptidase/D-alanyl-D-alanine-endopeptidase (penicillin-binding protein 4)